MENPKRRVLVVTSHPIQYLAPVFRLMTKDSTLDLLVAYCTLQGAERGKDPEFGFELAWDIPLLDGYAWVHVPNRSPRPGLGKFIGMINPRVWSIVRSGKFDAVVVYGYAYLSFWIAMLAAKLTRTPLIMVSDAVRLPSLFGGWWWKRWLKPPAVRAIYRMAEVVQVPSTEARQFQRSLGVPQERIALAHYTVDNDYFRRSAAAADRGATRDAWGIPANSVVVLFCGKLAPWKRPQDLLQAFARAASDTEGTVCPAFLVFAGDGPMRQSLDIEAQSLGVKERVRFEGFVNQSKLPEVYGASDLLVLPSQFEAWGLVVNEAMACGVPAVVSDQVGASADLIIPGKTGETYPVQDVNALAKILRELLMDPARLRRMGAGARERISTWSYREHIQGFVDSVESAVNLKRAGRPRDSGSRLRAPESRQEP